METFFVKLELNHTKHDNLISSEIPFKVNVDFNKTLEDVQPFLDEFNCLLLDDEVEGYTGIYPATGKKEIIDHIFLSSNIHHKSDLKIISRVKDYQIIYNVEKIVDLYDNYWSCDKWLLVRPNKDVSDHKAVKVTIKIKID